MRLAQAQPATAALVAGGVLLTAASAAAITATAGTASAATLTSQAVGQSCEPVQPPATQSPAPPSSPSPPTSPTATPTGSGSPSSSAVPTRTLKRSATTKPAAKASPTGKASPTASTTPAKPGTHISTQAVGDTAPSLTAATAATVPTSLCVKVARAQKSTERGKAAQWTVSVWTLGGSLPDAVIRLRATPAAGEAPGFSFGCGSADGTSLCDLGAIDAKSVPRQLKAQLTVPAGAATVKSVSLTVTGQAANLVKAPKASATVTITAPKAVAAKPPASPSPTPTSPRPSGSGSTPARAPSTSSDSATPPAAGGGSPSAPPATTPAQGAPSTPTPTRTPTTPSATPASPPDAATPAAEAAVPPVANPLPVGSLPGIPATDPTLSPGGNAATLFPTLGPTPSPASTPGSAAATNPHARQVANTSALPEGASVIGGQLIGLVALAIAFVLAVVRLSVRRRPAAGKGQPDEAKGEETDSGSAGKK